MRRIAVPPPKVAELIAEWKSIPLVRRAQVSIFVVALLLLFLASTNPTKTGDMLITVTAPAAAELQVYFDQGHGLSESASEKVPFPAGTSTLRFHLPQGKTERFRIDPPTNISQLTIDKIIFEKVTPTDVSERYAGSIHQLSELDLAPPASDSASTFIIRHGAADPQIHFVPTAPVSSSSQMRMLMTRVIWGFAIGGFILVLALQLGLRDSHLKLPVIALGLIIALASFAITSRSVSPDEDLHEADARYFASHWTPPRLDSVDMLPSYAASPYGVSYLSDWNVTYLMAGKFGKLTDEWGIDKRTGFRLYQATLFGSLLGLLLLLRLPAAAGIPLVLTPQIWYLFSYMNSDALPLASATLATAIAFAPTSHFRQFLAGARQLDLLTLMQAFVFVLCFATLIISKRNYWPIAVFIAASMAIIPLRLKLATVIAIAVLMIAAIVSAAGGRAIVETYGQVFIVGSGILVLVSVCLLLHWAAAWRKNNGSTLLAGRFLAVFLLSAAVAAPWIILDHHHNGTGEAKRTLVDAIRETHAAPEFKPNAPTPAPGLHMRDQGYSLNQLVAPPLNWHIATYKSFFGVYGYMQYYAAAPYYWLIGGATILLVLLGICSTLFMDPQSRSYLVLAVSCAISLVAASLLHSWTFDFQAQGRYVMGLVVLTMPFVFQFRASPRIRMASNTLIATIFLLGCYSFIAIAMPALIA